MARADCTYNLPAVAKKSGNYVIKYFGRDPHETARRRIVRVRLVELCVEQRASVLYSMNAGAKAAYCCTSGTQCTYVKEAVSEKRAGHTATAICCLRTVCKNFHTSGSETSIARTEDLFRLVAPVIGGLVEVCHAVDSNLTCSMIRAGV